jgi:septal ring factor EnvC (AmiA/AmiB activator)
MGNTKKMIVAALVLGLSSASVASADKLSDFKEAVSRRGCESIPYSDYRSSCQSQQSQVHDWCDGSRGPVSCGSENLTRQVKDNLEKEKKGVEALKEKRGKLQDSRSRASTEDEKNKIGKDIEQVEKDIYDAERRVGQAQKDLETRKKLVDDSIYNLDKCIDYRRAVMNSFAAALDKVRNENDTPEIADLARQLRNRYEEGKPGHEEQITARNNALNTCKNSRP